MTTTRNQQFVAHDELSWSVTYHRLALRGTFCFQTRLLDREASEIITFSTSKSLSGWRMLEILLYVPIGVRHDVRRFRPVVSQEDARPDCFWNFNS